MSTLRLNEAMQLVLSYYSENGYPKLENQKKIQEALESVGQQALPTQALRDIQWVSC
ncbi:MAG: hypothetical protein JJE21_09070 [Spirochaetaceae bacterium]|nr:hypothetical protein [Spirochaetaceae bacterium]